MKKITLLFLLLSAFAFSQNFAGKDVELYINKELKVKPVEANLQSYGYRGFYTDTDLKNVFSSGSGRSSKYESLNRLKS